MIKPIEEEWKLVLALAPPFSNLPTDFDPAQVAVSDQAIVRTVSGSGNSAVVLTRHSSSGSAKLEALFDPSWKEASRSDWPSMRPPRTARPRPP